MIFFSRKSNNNPDYILLACVTLLVVAGLIMLSSASSDLGKIKFNDTYYFLKHQLIYGFAVGLVGFIAGYKLHYKVYKKFATPFLLFTFIGLFMVLFTPFSFSFGGSTRWLQFGSLTLQPSEILKISFIIYLAAWLSSSGKERQNNFSSGFVPFIVLSVTAAVLLLNQPATSAVFIILFSALTVYFMSGAKYVYIVSTVALAAIALLALIYFTPYRFERLSSFLTPRQNIQGSGYHLNQALITIGSGGLTGVGFGKSTNKYRYLPESIGDSIFAVVGEEFGFIGSTALVAVFFLLVLRGFVLARKVRDEFGRLLMIGFTTLIGIQVFVNIGAISGLIPLTGVTLPYISYGGTSLAVFMTIAGIMTNISKYAQ